MRKIRKFELTQSRSLSAVEMAELNGGGSLPLDRCSETTLGESCVYDAKNKIEGTCVYTYDAAEGSSGYYCAANPWKPSEG